MSGQGLVNRIRGHIPWTNVDSRLRALREIWVATSSPLGRRDAAPNWFWWDGDVVHFTCGAESRKTRNIAHVAETVTTRTHWRRERTQDRARA
jgi:hypothetical protein